MNDKNEFTGDTKRNKMILDIKKLDLDAGWLGKCFGTESRAPINIAGVFIFVLIFSGILVLFIDSSMTAIQYWNIISPLLALALGYLFGKNSK